MFDVVAVCPLDADWEARQEAMVLASGRRYTQSEADVREVVYLWVVPTLKGARGIQRRIRDLGVGIEVAIKEHTSCR